MSLVQEPHFVLLPLHLVQCRLRLSIRYIRQGLPHPRHPRLSHRHVVRVPVQVGSFSSRAAIGVANNGGCAIPRVSFCGLFRGFEGRVLVGLGRRSVSSGRSSSIRTVLSYDRSSIVLAPS